MIPVAANDVAFSTHAVLLTAFTLFQIAIYDVSSLNLNILGLSFKANFSFSFFFTLDPASLDNIQGEKHIYFFLN